MVYDAFFGKLQITFSRISNILGVFILFWNIPGIYNIPKIPMGEFDLEKRQREQKTSPIDASV